MVGRFCSRRMAPRSAQTLDSCARVTYYPLTQVTAVFISNGLEKETHRRREEAFSAGSARERAEQAALAFFAWVKERSDGFAVLTHDAPTAVVSSGGFSSRLDEVAERVSDLFAEAFKQAGYDPDVAPICAHALIGMVALVGQWWSVVRKPSVDEVATQIVALAWTDLWNLPKKPDPIGARKG